MTPLDTALLIVATILVALAAVLHLIPTNASGYANGIGWAGMAFYIVSYLL